MHGTICPKKEAPLTYNTQQDGAWKPMLGDRSQMILQNAGWFCLYEIQEEKELKKMVSSGKEGLTGEGHWGLPGVKEVFFILLGC